MYMGGVSKTQKKNLLQFDFVARVYIFIIAAVSTVTSYIIRTIAVKKKCFIKNINLIDTNYH